MFKKTRRKLIVVFVDTTQKKFDFQEFNDQFDFLIYLMEQKSIMSADFYCFDYDDETMKLIVSYE